ncbi:MAG: choice-of-anchor tandem repeat GloVer-containing protein [Candidatus Cybelea sp.]
MHLGFARHALTSCAAVAMLAGCGGSQPPIGAAGEMGQSSVSSGYTSLHSFGQGLDGQEPKAGLIGASGTLYGTTYGGGTYNLGTVFSIGATGGERVLYSFQGTAVRDGANPSASLIERNGLLYGTTEYGGYLFGHQCNAGTVFRINTAGSEKVLYRFHGYFCDSVVYNDGANPVASLIDISGKLYGTTVAGGSYEFYGTVFRVSSTTGKEKVIHSFSQSFEDGGSPVANLLDVKGTMYGTTEYGGQVCTCNGGGTVFSIKPTGAEQVLHVFDQYGNPEGSFPQAGLISINGALYGTTPSNGVNGGGTAFSITTNGNLTILHSFGSGSDGSGTFAPLLNVRGKLYGTTELGGAYGKGTIFRVTDTGKEEVLHSFGYGSDGATPLAGLIDVNGTLYGTTSAGGTYGDGTVFALKP